MKQLVNIMFRSNNRASFFTCGERKIWQNIKKSQVIMKMIKGTNFHLKQTALSARTKFAQR